MSGDIVAAAEQIIVDESAKADPAVVAWVAEGQGYDLGVAAGRKQVEDEFDPSEPCNACGSAPPLGDDAALFVMTREQRKVDVIARITIDGEPVSKSRARFTGRGSKTRAYTPEKTRDAEKAIAWKFRQQRPGYVPTTAETFGVCAIFFAGTRQRRDVDNMLKLILDALNKVAWTDDVQVEEVSGRRGYDKTFPRTEILIYRLGLVEGPPTARCPHCDVRFNTYKSWKGKVYCSRKCAVAVSVLARVRTCETCGSEFQAQATTDSRRYCSDACSREAGRISMVCIQCGEAYVAHRSTAHKGAPCCGKACRDAYWRARRTVNAKGICCDCAGPTSKKNYDRCRACGIAYRAKGRTT